MTSLELIGAAISLIAIWLTAQRSRWCFPIGIVSVLIYVYIFYQAKLYADTGLQVVFIIALIIGWVRWTAAAPTSKVSIVPLPFNNILLWLLAGAIATLALGYALARYTDGAFTYVDAGTTVYSLIAQWWVVRRHIANWVLWIVVDMVYVGLYIAKDLYITAALYAIFIALAVYGWQAWRKQT
jgi:nicotinamide mononucleotide transporter